MAVAFVDRLMRRIDLLSTGTVQFKPGRVGGTREYVVHPNYIVVYRLSEALRRIEILRLWTVWNQPCDRP